MKTEIIKAEDYGLEQVKVKGIEDAFAPKIAEREELNKYYIELLKEELTPELSKKAGDLRKKLVKVRTGIADIHKTQKAFFLASGQYVDAWKNKETEPVKQMEEKLVEIEKYAENLERDRIEKLQAERVELLSEFVEDASERNLAIMDSDVWDSYLATKKKAHIDFLQAEKDAEKKRIAREKAEQVEQKRIKEENAKLKAEAEKRKAEELVEKNKRDEQARKERAKFEAILKAERDAKQKIEAQIKAKQEVEYRVEQEENRRVRVELDKGDGAKVHDLIIDLKSLKTKYTFQSVKAQKMYKDVGLLIDKITNHIEK